MKIIQFYKNWFTLFSFSNTIQFSGSLRHSQIEVSKIIYHLASVSCDLLLLLLK